METFEVIAEKEKELTDTTMKMIQMREAGIPDFEEYKAIQEKYQKLINETYVFTSII